MSQPAVEVGEVTAEALDYLAAHLRQQDRDEIAAAGLGDLRQALQLSVRMSQWTHLARVNGRPAAVFGLGKTGTLLAPVGIPWLLGTDDVRRHARVLQRMARDYIPRMLGEYPHLMNAVHVRNTVSIAWLKRLGFTFSPPFQNPWTGEPFHFFEMRRHV